MWSNRISFTKSANSWNCSSVSPGNPTIRDVRNVICSLRLRILCNKATIFSRVSLRFIRCNTVLLICCSGISIYLHTFGSVMIVSSNSSEKCFGYKYNIRIHSIPSIFANRFNNSESSGVPLFKSAP